MNADSNGALPTAEDLGYRRIIEFLDDPEAHGLRLFGRKAAQSVEQGSAVCLRFDAGNRADRIVIHVDHSNAKSIACLPSDPQVPPVAAELVAGDPIEPLPASAPCGIESREALKSRRE